MVHAKLNFKHFYPTNFFLVAATTFTNLSRIIRTSLKIKVYSHIPCSLYYQAIAFKQDAVNLARHHSDARSALVALNSINRLLPATPHSQLAYQNAQRWPCGSRVQPCRL